MEIHIVIRKIHTFLLLKISYFNRHCSFDDGSTYFYKHILEIHVSIKKTSISITKIYILLVQLHISEAEIDISLLQIQIYKENANFNDENTYFVNGNTYFDKGVQLYLVKKNPYFSIMEIYMSLKKMPILILQVDRNLIEKHISLMENMLLTRYLK